MPIPMCPDCGAELPGGDCPSCPVGPGLDGAGSALRGAGDTLDLPAGPGSVLQVIGATIGAVPRVLLRDTAPGEGPSPVLRPSCGQDTSTRYRIDGEIARGGMGAILKGRDPDLGRDVAIKVLREDLRDDHDLVRRFVEEAQIAGQLQHPGVVPIYELGTFADGRPFFCMKLVKGKTLADLLAARQAPGDDLPRFLAIFEAMAQAMAYAHTRGVIHRDLKPSNIMVGSFGEVQVMDWGLAKVLARGGIAADARAGREKPPETLIATARSGSDVELSQAGSILGTPSYMPPEQARGEAEAIDERADVFALGSILGEILTGAPAFTGRTPGEILRKAARGDTADVLERLDGSGAEAGLIGLAGDCLEAEPEDRPRDANAVADRLTAHLAGVQERVRAAERERAVAVARAAEERKRRRLQLGLAASLIGLMALGGGGYAWDQRRGAERIARTARAVDEALAEASRLQGEAQAAPSGEMARWSEALSAAKRAEGLMAQGEADAALRGRVAGLTARIGRERSAAADKAGRIEADRALLSELEAIRGAFAEHSDARRSDSEHAAAFLKAGLNLDRVEPAESGGWIAARSVPVELAGYLDIWARLRFRAGRPEADWRRLVSAARAADSDPWRDALRARIGVNDAGAAEELHRLAGDEEALDAQPAASLVLLASQLGSGPGDRERAARVLRRAAFRHPADYWARINLGWVLTVDPGNPRQESTRREEIVRHLTAAVAIRPRSFVAHVNLGLALSDQGKHEEAVAEHREAIRLKPDEARAHFGLGHAQWNLGKHEEAIAELREAVRLDGDRPGQAIFSLGGLLQSLGRGDEALAAYREAIRIEPRSARARAGLGDALLGQGKHDEAVAEFREAARLGPDGASDHYRLGLALRDLGKHEEAIAELREAVRMDGDRPGDAIFALGGLLERMGRGDEALAVYREAIRIEPRSARARSGLESALRAKDLEGRFPALLKGEGLPRDAADRLVLAEMCRNRGYYVAAARLQADALQADPKLGDDRGNGHRYNAACYAAMAATGKGKDDPPPDDAAKAGLRGQALGCLKAEHAAWAEALETGTARSRSRIVPTLRRWKSDSDLAGVRDPDALSGLTEAEREVWRAFWGEVDALLKRAWGSKP